MPPDFLTHRRGLSLGLAALVLSLSACKPVASHDEVSRVRAPGPSGLDAVLVEVGAGATSSFRYDLFVLPPGAAAQGKPVLSLVGATRNTQAYGANLRWQGPAHLRVEYLQAQSVQGQPGTVTVGQQSVQVELAPGVTDPDAPAGGMDYNRRALAPGSAASR